MKYLENYKKCKDRKYDRKIVARAIEVLDIMSSVKRCSRKRKEKLEEKRISN